MIEITFDCVRLKKYQSLCTRVHSIFELINGWAFKSILIFINSNEPKCLTEVSISPIEKFTGF